MTPAELWQAVGEALLVQRTRRGWKPFHVQKNGGPNYATIQEIEKGQVGNVAKLEQYVAALDLNLTDVLRSVLKTEDEPSSPEILQLVGRFARTTPEGRSALLAMARLLPDDEAIPTTPSESPSARQGVKPRKR